jgi:hypothetical protein
VQQLRGNEMRLGICCIGLGAALILVGTILTVIS